MIPFDEIDKRLTAIGKDRKWLAESSGRKINSIIAALAPNAIPSKRSELLRKALSDAIVREELAISGLRAPRIHGIYDVEQTAEQSQMTYKACQLVNAPSIEEFCLQAILFRANEIMERGTDPVAGKELASKQEPKPGAKQVSDSQPANILPIGHHSELSFYGLVAAGQPASPFDTEDGTVEAPGTFSPKTHFALRVNGRSMEPDYPDGSLIVCRKLRKGEIPSKGTDVVACDPAGSYLKRLAYVKDGPKGDAPRKARPRLVSLNPDFPEVIPQSDCPVQAVVVAKV